MSIVLFLLFFINRRKIPNGELQVSDSDDQRVVELLALDVGLAAVGDHFLLALEEIHEE